MMRLLNVEAVIPALTGEDKRNVSSAKLAGAEGRVDMCGDA